MEKQLSPKEIEEQELADKFTALYKERLELELKRGNGVTLDKNSYIGDRSSEIEAELSKLKTPKPNSEDNANPSTSPQKQDK